VSIIRSLPPLTNSINRAGLEDAINTKSHGNKRLRVQWWKAPDDGHRSVRNIRAT
jgi:hypothetical protein